MVEWSTRVSSTSLILSVTVMAAMAPALAADERPRIALVIPGPPNCVIDGLTRPLMLESDIDPATVTQYCFSDLRDVPRQMREIVATKPSVLLIFASPVAARAAHEASPALPIVFADVPDPVGNGLAKTLARPGLNLTGITSNTDELLGKRIEILKESLPSVTRVAFLGNLTNEGQPGYWRVARDAALKVKIESKVYTVESQSQLAGAFAAMEQDRMQAVVLLPDAWLFPNRVEIFALAAKHHLPVMSGNSVYAELGGLLTYGADLSAMARKAWAYVHKILSGAEAGDLPIEQPTELNFIVNAKTARDQGFRVSPAAMVRATRVIE
jgi:putative ABC transport system substrate-binding protein